jgi:hypothetical protein
MKKANIYKIIYVIIAISFLQLNIFASSKTESETTDSKNKIDSESKWSSTKQILLFSGFVGLTSYYVYEVGKNNDSQSVAGVHAYMAIGTLLLGFEKPGWQYSLPWFASMAIASSTFLTGHYDEEKEGSNFIHAQKSLQLWLATLSATLALDHYFSETQKVTLLPSINQEKIVTTNLIYNF